MGTLALLVKLFFVLFGVECLAGQKMIPYREH
jgi:hypothetical protein